MSYAKVATLMVVGRLCNGTLVAQKQKQYVRFLDGLDLGVPHRDNPNPIPIFWATRVPLHNLPTTINVATFA